MFPGCEPILLTLPVWSVTIFFSPLSSDLVPATCDLKGQNQKHFTKSHCTFLLLTALAYKNLKFGPVICTKSWEGGGGGVVLLVCLGFFFTCSNRVPVSLTPFICYIHKDGKGGRETVKEGRMGDTERERELGGGGGGGEKNAEIGQK